MWLIGGLRVLAPTLLISPLHSNRCSGGGSASDQESRGKTPSTASYPAPILDNSWPLNLESFTCH